MTVYPLLPLTNWDVLSWSTGWQLRLRETRPIGSKRTVKKSRENIKIQRPRLRKCKPFYLTGLAQKSQLPFLSQLLLHMHPGDSVHFFVSCGGQVPHPIHYCRLHQTFHPPKSRTQYITWIWWTNTCSLPTCQHEMQSIRPRKVPYKILDS